MPQARVVGIDIDSEPERVRADVIKYARLAAARLNVPFDEATVDVVAGHAGPAYGVPHQATIEAIRLAGRLEGLALDPVYSGKGLAGLIALIRDGRWQKGDDIVFIHTGGSPALFAYQSNVGSELSERARQGSRRSSAIKCSICGILWNDTNQAFRSSRVYGRTALYSLSGSR